MTVTELDVLPPGKAAALLAACCGSRAWTAAMVARRPFATRDALVRGADDEWARLAPADWLEAFSHHPRIGEQSAAAPAGGTASAWSAGEQARVATAAGPVQQRLALAQRDYEARFGHIFLICAAGKSADEILAAARARLHNDPATELRVAAEEQRQIMRLRLEKLIRER